MVLNDKKGSPERVRRFDATILEGLFMKNALFSDGMVVAPAVVMAYTMKNSFALIFVFSVVSFITLTVASFLPKKIVYTLRIILYTLIAALVFIPVDMCAKTIFPVEYETLGVFIPLLITNSLIITKSEQRFFLKTKGRMFIDIVCYIVGYDAAILIMGILRELISTGSVGSRIYGVPFTVSGMALPFGGFIFLAFAAAAVRRIQIAVRRSEDD